MQQSQLSYLVLHSHLFQQSHLFNSITNSVLLSISRSYLIQQPHIFNSVRNSVVLSNFSFISHSIVPHIQPCNKFNCFISFYILIYFKSVQIHLFYLIPQSNFIQQLPHIQKCNKFNILILFTLYLIQQFHIFNSLTNSVLLSNFSFTSHSTVPHIQQDRKFSSII